LVAGVNNNALGLVNEAIKKREELRLEVKTGPLECTVVDPGVKRRQAMRQVSWFTKICLGGY